MPSPYPLPQGEEDIGRGGLWEPGREAVREAPGEGRYERQNSPRFRPTLTTKKVDSEPVGQHQGRSVESCLAQNGVPAL